MLINILGGIAALALAASAYLAWENQGAYKEQISARQQEEALLLKAQKNFKESKNQNKISKDDLAAKQEEQKEIEEEFAKHKEEDEKIKAQIEQQKEEIASEQTTLEELQKSLEEFENVDELIADVKSTLKEVQNLDASITTSKSKRSSLDSSSISLEKQIADTRARIGRYSDAQSSPNLNTRVSQVFNGYGFVTISGGDNLGIIKGSTLDVIRGGETVAKLQVTTVESGSSAADIVPGSMGDGVSVYSGDKVVAGTPNN